MLFLIWLLTSALGVGYVRGKTRKFNWKKLSQISKIDYRRGKEPTQRFRKINNLRQVLKIYENLNENQKNLISEYFTKQYHVHGWNKKSEFASFMRELHLIVKKKQRGATLTKIDESLLRAAKDIFIGNKRVSYYKPLNSTWLVSCKYTKSSKRLWVKMIRGQAIYKFVGVPEDDYILLITLSIRAGRYWYREKFGSKYSSNPNYWIIRGG